MATGDDLMKKIFSITLFLLAFGLSAFAQDNCTRYTEAAAGFSFCQPAGWTLVEREGSPFKLVMAPPADVFRANLNTRADDSTLDLKDYVDGSIKSVLEGTAKMGATSIVFVSRSEFVTDSGAKGVKVTYRTEYKGLIIFSAQYFIDTGKGKLLVTGTALESEKGVDGKLFDAAMKTFRVIKPN
jgi:hypothetical protein